MRAGWRPAETAEYSAVAGSFQNRSFGKDTVTLRFRRWTLHIWTAGAARMGSGQRTSCNGSTPVVRRVSCQIERERGDVYALVMAGRSKVSNATPSVSWEPVTAVWMVRRRKPDQFPFLISFRIITIFVFLIVFNLSITLPSPADADVGSSPTCDTTGHLLLSFLIKPGCPDGQGSA